jgi:hypothetical protein
VDDEPQEKPVSLEEAVSFALDEARMVLPGIQALFGFQLVAVFNQRFADLFDEPGQLLHLGALVLVALSCALAMTPAALHRQTHRRKVSERLLRQCSFFIGAAMVPLMAAISIDVGLVGYAVTSSRAVGTALAVLCAAVFIALWIGVPQLRKRLG